LIPASDRNGVSVDRIIRDLVLLFPRLIGTHIEIALALDAAGSFIQANVEFVEQVVTTLAAQAADSMPDGGVLCIETSPILVDMHLAAFGLAVPPGRYVQLVISDTGAGTLNGRDCPGFTTMNELVQNNGGSISVHSAPVFGTTLRILLPEAGGSDANEATAPEEDIAGGTETVLVVEDDRGMREYVRDNLTVRGYFVIEARNCGEALDAARQHEGPIDLLLTDFVLPDGNGDDIAGEVRRVHPGIAILTMSGARGIGRCSDDGRDYLQKPFVPSELLKTTRRLLDSRGGQTWA
jgi:two-component system cell cycle sensor histidine kinase/response regulator CckA